MFLDGQEHPAQRSLEQDADTNSGMLICSTIDARVMVEIFLQLRTSNLASKGVRYA